MMNEQLKNAKSGDVFRSDDGDSFLLIRVDSTTHPWCVRDKWGHSHSTLVDIEIPFITTRTWTKLEPAPELGEPLRVDSGFVGEKFPAVGYCSGLHWAKYSGYPNLILRWGGGTNTVEAQYHYTGPHTAPLPEQKPKLPEPPKFKCVARKKDGTGDTVFVTQVTQTYIGGVVERGQYRWLKIDEAELVDHPGITPDPELVALFSEGGAS